MLAQITSYLGRMRSLLPSLRAEGYYVPYLYWDFLMCFSSTDVSWTNMYEVVFIKCRPTSVEGV